MLDRRRNWLREYSDLSKNFSLTKFDYPIMSFSEFNYNFPNLKNLPEAQTSNPTSGPDNPSQNPIKKMEMIALYYFYCFLEKSLKENALFKNLTTFLEFTEIFLLKNGRPLSTPLQKDLKTILENFLLQLSSSSPPHNLNRTINTHLLSNPRFTQIYLTLINALLPPLSQDLILEKIPYLKKKNLDELPVNFNFSSISNQFPPQKNI